VFVCVCVFVPLKCCAARDGSVAPSLFAAAERAAEGVAGTAEEQGQQGPDDAVAVQRYFPFPAVSLLSLPHSLSFLLVLVTVHSAVNLNATRANMQPNWDIASTNGFCVNLTAVLLRSVAPTLCAHCLLCYLVTP
jgi:hypothetical protein